MAFHAVKGREEFAKAKQSTSKLRLFLSVCCTCRVVVLLNKRIAILTTSLRSLSSMLKLPFVSGAPRNATRQNRLQGRQLKLGQKSKRKADPCYLFIYLFIYLFRYSFLSFGSLRLQNISSSRKISALCQNLTQKIVILISVS